MTKNELYLRACQYAVLQLEECKYGAKYRCKGQSVEWLEVLQWLDKQLEQAEKLKEY